MTPAQQVALPEEDAKLLARAVQYTRVSYFTMDERARLGELVSIVTGYRITKGLGPKAPRPPFNTLDRENA